MVAQYLCVCECFWVRGLSLLYLQQNTTHQDIIMTFGNPFAFTFPFLIRHHDNRIGFLTNDPNDKRINISTMSFFPSIIVVAHIQYCAGLIEQLYNHYNALSLCRKNAYFS